MKKQKYPEIINQPDSVMEFGKSNKNEVDVVGVVVLGYDPTTNLWLALKWNKKPVYWLAGGGKESNEGYFEAATRELEEETGYIEYDNVFQLGAAIKSHYYNDNKKSHRKSYGYSYLFILDASRRSITKLESHEDFSPIWMPYIDLHPEINKIGAEHWMEILNRAKSLVDKRYQQKTM